MSAAVDSRLAARTAAGHLADDLAAHALWLARRFSAGATMWCWSRQWPAHARHVAVEFVHPVVVGTRALPAVVIPPGDDLCSAMRACSRAGDVLVVLADGDDPDATDAARRAPAWGVETVWIGAGSGPPSDLPVRRLWLPTDDPLDADECLARVYHVLWELTHVCFEHPGLLGDPADRVCVTCADEAELAEIERAAHPHAEELVDARVAGRHERIDVSLLDRAEVGDLVLVHAGTAIATAPGQAST